MEIQIFQMLENINSRLSNLEKNINRLEEKLDLSLCIQRNHLIRIKNGQEIDDNMILLGRPYNDLSPQKAHDLFSNGDLDFLVLDVSKESYKKKGSLKGSIHIPLEQIEKRYHEIQSRTTPILVISEQGLRSIQACELMVKKGYFNVNNISGGHQFWPGKQVLEEKSA